MKIFLYSVLISLVYTQSVFAIMINDEQIKYMSQKIFNDCNKKTLTVECPALSTFQNCKYKEKKINNIEDVSELLTYLNSIYGRGSLFGPTLMNCKEHTTIINQLVSTSSCYLWNNECISNLPATQNIYSAKTHGDNSPAIAGNDNSISLNNENIISNTVKYLIFPIIVGVVIFLLNHFLLRKLKKHEK